MNILTQEAKKRQAVVECAIKNAEYELENGQITCEYQYGISNEVLKGKTAEISLSEGRLLLIKVY